MPVDLPGRSARTARSARARGRGAWRGWCSRVAAMLGAALLCSGLLPSTQSTRAGQATAASGHFAYLFDQSGAFAKIGLSDRSIAAYWNLAWANSAGSKIPNCRGANFADPACNLLFGGLQESGRNLYGVFPTADSVGRGGNNLNFQVVKIELPEMMLSDVAAIPQAQAEWPPLVVDPAKNRVFVSYRDAENEKKMTEPTIISVVDVYDGKNLKKLATLRESTSIRDIRSLRSNPGTVFGYKAYFSPDGKTIFEGLYVTAVSERAMIKRYVNPLDKLSPEQRDRLKPYQRKDPISQKPSFDFAAGDSAAGRTVVRISDAARGQAAYWTVDLNSGDVSPVIIARFGIDHLSPDGRLLLIQGGEVKKSDSGANELMGAPAFWIYDVATGKQLGQFQIKSLPESAAESEFSCISASGEHLIVAAKGTVALLSVPDGNAVAEFRTTPLGHPAGGCVFVDK